ncbi:MAG: 2,3-bisphosphoglycerate-independent phosphoglycerate mutase, partial [Desulfofundulus kuznetsovii]
LATGGYQVIIMNYANADMVGHTGNLEVTVKAIETVDFCLGRVIAAVLEKGGTALVTADHGNAEEMQDEEEKPHTAHTTNPVPFILVNEGLKNVVLRRGRLEDIAPTVLYLLGIPKPPQMTGNCLITGMPEIL